MLLKEILDNEIKAIFKNKVLKLSKKKLKLKKSKQNNFTKYTKLSHFIMIYVNIYHLAQ